MHQKAFSAGALPRTALAGGANYDASQTPSRMGKGTPSPYPFPRRLRLTPSDASARPERGRARSMTRKPSPRRRWIGINGVWIVPRFTFKLTPPPLLIIWFDFAPVDLAILFRPR